MQTEDWLTAAAIALGLAGIVVPILPGTLLVAIAIVAWAAYVGGSLAWAVAGIAVVALALGTVVKYAVPGRRLRTAGVPTRTLALGGLLGIVGFFVVPVAGLILGFVLGVYLAELGRVGRAAAGPATIAAVKAVAASIAIEMAAGLVAAGVWLTGALMA